jgi:WD40 repeat protein
VNVGIFDKLMGKTTARGPSWTRTIEDHPVGLAYALGGKSLVVLTGGGSLLVLDAKSGETQRTIVVHEAGALTMACDGARVVTGGMDGKACLVDLASGTITHRLEADAEWVEHVAIGSDGSFAIAAGKLVRWIGADGTLLAKLGPHASTVNGLSFSPDASKLAAARYGGVDLWKRDGEKDRELAWKSSLVSVAWQPKDRFIAGGCQDNAVHFWRLETNDDSMMGGYAAKPKAIAWSYDGTSLATGGGEEIVVWSFRGRGPEGTSPIQLRGHTKLVTTIVAAPSDHRFASGGRDGLFCVWRPQRSETPIAQHAMSAPVAHVAFASDGSSAAAADEKGQLVVLPLA